MPENESKQDEPKPVAPKVETPEEKKQAAADKRQAELDAKAAKEQSERDAADIETFLSSVRGERVLRGPGGTFDLEAHLAAEEADRAAKREAAEKD